MRTLPFLEPEARKLVAGGAAERNHRFPAIKHRALRQERKNSNLTPRLLEAQTPLYTRAA